MKVKVKFIEEIVEFDTSKREVQEVELNSLNQTARALMMADKSLRVRSVGRAYFKSVDIPKKIWSKPDYVYEMPIDIIAQVIK